MSYFKPRIAIVGEAWGKDEAAKAQAFVGYTGRLLRLWLERAEIKPSDCFLTNVFNLQPQPTNDIKNLCGTKTEGIVGYPPLQKGKYVKAAYASELRRLHHELRTHRPNIIVAAGATAAWALLKTTGIANIRGTVFLWDGIKVLPTYHPSAVARQPTLYPVILADLKKTKRESLHPEHYRTKRTIHIPESIKDIQLWKEQHLPDCKLLSVDIETANEQITCIGFASSPYNTIVIPFYREPTADNQSLNYWPTLDDEIAAWREAGDILTCGIPTTGQNYKYDMHFLYRKYGLQSPYHTHDTMLLHHALQPEMQKSLGFLASIYTDEVSWKTMRKTNKQEG